MPKRKIPPASPTARKFANLSAQTFIIIFFVNSFWARCLQSPGKHQLDPLRFSSTNWHLLLVFLFIFIYIYFSRDCFPVSTWFLSTSLRASLLSLVTIGHRIFQEKETINQEASCPILKQIFSLLICYIQSGNGINWFLKFF